MEPLGLNESITVEGVKVKVTQSNANEDTVKIIKV